MSKANLSKHKYSAKRTEAHGKTFPSMREAKRWGELLLLERAGEIRNLEYQPEFPVFINGVRCFVYRADASYFTDKGRAVEDVKGVKTAVYRIKKKCVEAYYGFEIREV